MRMKILKFFELIGLIRIIEPEHNVCAVRGGKNSPERLIIQAMVDYERATKKKIKSITIPWRSELGKSPITQTVNFLFEEAEVITG